MSRPGPHIQDKRDSPGLQEAQTYLELVWIADEGEARANRLRLDRRADWAHSGASPFGLALRGQLSEPEIGDYWLYGALGVPIWVYRYNERAPERPLVFVLEAALNELEQRRPRSRAPERLAHRHPSALRSVRVMGPARRSLPRYAGPPIDYSPGLHRLELVVGDGALRAITDILVLRG
jgi:hypothetical protein